MFETETQNSCQSGEMSHNCGKGYAALVAKSISDVKPPLQSETKPYISGTSEVPLTELSILKNNPTNDARQFECEVCGKKFSTMNILKLHQPFHSKERSFTCRVCGRWFSRQGAFLAHMRMHKGKKPFACETCGKTFFRKALLVIHQRLHTGERPYVCDVCHKAFMRKAELLAHSRIHTGERPFVCVFCKKGFVQHGSMKMHLRLHTGEKPFMCEVCNRAFRLKSQLSDHHRSSHSGHGKIWFVTDLCPKLFTSKSNLRKHLRQYHQEEEDSGVYHEISDNDIYLDRLVPKSERQPGTRLIARPSASDAHNEDFSDVSATDQQYITPNKGKGFKCHKQRKLKKSKATHRKEKRFVCDKRQTVRKSDSETPSLETNSTENISDTHLRLIAHNGTTRQRGLKARKNTHRELTRGHTATAEPAGHDLLKEKRKLPTEQSNC